MGGVFIKQRASINIFYPVQIFGTATGENKWDEAIGEDGYASIAFIKAGISSSATSKLLKN